MAKEDSSSKIFLLDTNVILHDSSCIYQFQEHDIVIPITVLEELDSFKKGNQTLNFHAREFVRELDGLSGEKLMNGGVNIGSGRGTIRIVLGEELHEDLKKTFHSPDLKDHRILNTAYCLNQEFSEKEVILVTKDVNLRMKAKSLNIPAQDYKSDQVTDVQSLYDGLRQEHTQSGSLIDRVYEESGGVPASEYSFGEDMRPNEYLILRNGTHSVLGKYNAGHHKICRVEKETAYGITPRNAEQTFAMEALLNPDSPLVSITGKAGTGKTLLALAAALERRREYRQIYLARPIIPLSNRDMGYLPGDVEEKVDPFMQPIYDNLAVIKDQFDGGKKAQKVDQLLDEDKLEIEPLSYIRGRSLVKIYFIVDEAQNLTPHEIKTIITRAGEGTKVVFTGDINQIDHPYLDSQSNGLSYLIDRMQDERIYSHIHLEKSERSHLAEVASDRL